MSKANTYAMNALYKNNKLFHERLNIFEIKTKF